MKKNKVLAIILSVSLLPAMLAGCMPGSMQENKESAPVESPASDSQAVSEAASTEEASNAADGYSLPFCEPGSVFLSLLIRTGMLHPFMIPRMVCRWKINWRN